MRLTRLVRLLEAARQDDDKIRVTRKDTGKPTLVTRRTLEKNPQLYEAPGVTPSKKQQRKDRAKQEERKRQREEEQSDQGARDKELTDEQKRKKDAIEWYLYDYEGRERPRTEPETPKPPRGKKPKLTLKDLEDLSRPDRRGQCPEGFEPKTFVHKGLKQRFTRCVPKEG